MSWKLSLSLWNEYSWFLRQRDLSLESLFVLHFATIGTTEERLKRSICRHGRKITSQTLSSQFAKLSYHVENFFFQCRLILSVAFIIRLMRLSLSNHRGKSIFECVPIKKHLRSSRFQGVMRQTKAPKWNFNVEKTLMKCWYRMDLAYFNQTHHYDIFDVKFHNLDVQINDIFIKLYLTSNKIAQKLFDTNLIYRSFKMTTCNFELFVHSYQTGSSGSFILLLIVFCILFTCKISCLYSRPIHRLISTTTTTKNTSSDIKHVLLIFILAQ